MLRGTPKIIVTLDEKGMERIPNKRTQEAMTELEEGGGERLTMEEFKNLLVLQVTEAYSPPRRM